MKAKVKTKQIDYNGSALDFYHSINDKDNTMLLESADITTKNSQNSWVVMRSAIRIVATTNTVKITALNSNGIEIIKQVSPELNEFIESSDEQSMELKFAPVDFSAEEQIRITQPNVLQVLRVIQNHYSYLGKNLFLCGAFGYELIDINEDLPAVNPSDNSLPAYVYYVADVIADIDHIDKTTTINNIMFCNNNIEQKKIENLIDSIKVSELKQKQCEEKSVDLTPNIDDKAYEKMVETCIDYIRAGDAFQIVPARNFKLPCPHPLQTYQTLKQINPSPYMFYMNDENFTIFGASPESALKYTAGDNVVSLYPIAGTRPRGKNPNGSIDNDLDNRYELDLRLDKKETAEHIMLVDLARNDIARISIPSTRTVNKLMNIDKYSHVQHLVSEVSGKLKNNLDCLHAYQMCMNMGTLTGAPKIRATEIIRELECTARGSYGGAVGYINGNGDMDTCITIRSAFIKDGQAYIGAGAGVVLDSNPTDEANETRLKAMSVVQAIIKTHNYKIKGND